MMSSQQPTSPQQPSLPKQKQQNQQDHHPPAHPDGTEASQTEAVQPPKRRTRLSASMLVAGVLALGLGFATATQMRQTEKTGLQSLSQPELVSLLANVNDQSARLEAELGELRAQKARLADGSNASTVAEAQKRLDQLNVLNGTVKVSGPGIRIVINNGKDVTAANVLDAVQELRDAGAESIDVGGNRVVARTWFADDGDHISVSGQRLNDDFTVTAIGDSHTLGTAMAIPGGVTDTLSQAGARVKVTEEQSVTIDSVATNSVASGK